MRINKPSRMALLCLICAIAVVSIVSAASSNSNLEMTRLTIPAEQKIDYGGLISQDFAHETLVNCDRGLSGDSPPLDKGGVRGGLTEFPRGFSFNPLLTSPSSEGEEGRPIKCCTDLVDPYLNDFVLTMAASLAPTTAADTSTENFVPAQGPVQAKIDYGGLIAQDLTFLIVRNALRLTDEDTRENLSGPFVEDWFDSVSTLWNERARFYDNGKFFTNQIAHPWAGSTAAFIFANNDSISRNAKFGNNKEYWRAKKRQFVFTVIDTALFEIGPISESSLGNIRQGWVDFILTPTLGIAWSIGEDALKAKVLDPMYPKHPKWHNFLFIVLNPTRSGANLMAFKKPWYRD